MSEDEKFVLSVDDADKMTRVENGFLIEWFNREGRDYQLFLEDVGLRLMKYTIDMHPSSDADIPATKPYVTLTSCETKHPTD